MIQGTVTIAYLDPGHWSACFGMSLRDLYLFEVALQRHPYEVRVQSGAGAIADGRNYATQQFLDGSSEWLFFVDTDMGFASDTIERLINTADPDERPVMGGLCFTLYEVTPSSFHGVRYGVMPAMYSREDGGFNPVTDYKRDAVQQVDATGAACLLIHRSVLEKIRDKFGKVWFNEMPKTGEDLSFCRRCDQAGVPVHVNTAVKTTHHKGALYLDEDHYMRNRPWTDEDWQVT